MSTKTFKFRTPSNQLITIDDKYAYRDIITIEDLKYLFTLKNRLYTMNIFEIALSNNTLELNTVISSLVVDEYTIIHTIKERDYVSDEQISSTKLETQSISDVSEEQISSKNIIIEEFKENTILENNKDNYCICQFI